MENDNLEIALNELEVLKEEVRFLRRELIGLLSRLKSIEDYRGQSEKAER